MTEKLRPYDIRIKQSKLENNSNKTELSYFPLPATGDFDMGWTVAEIMQVINKLKL